MATSKLWGWTCVVVWILSCIPVQATVNRNEAWQVNLRSTQRCVEFGRTVTYRLDVTRLGPPVTGAKIRDDRDTQHTTGYTRLDHADSATISSTGNYVVWDLPPMNPGDTWSASYDVNTLGGPNDDDILVYSYIQTTPDHLSVDYLVGGPSSTGNHTDSGNEGSQSEGDPVNMATGESYTGPYEDFNLGGPSGVTLSRYYASGLADEGHVQSPLGDNWMHNFDLRVVKPTNWSRVVVFEKGKLIYFHQLWGNSEGERWALNFEQEPIPYQLKEDEQGDLWLMDPVRERVYHFDGEGWLIETMDRRDNRITVMRDSSSQQITQITDGLGRHLNFEYEGDHLTAVVHGDRRVTYTYDDQEHLSAVTNALAQTTSYAYAEDRTHGPLMTHLTKPKGNTPYTQAYDVSARVIRQVTARGDVTTLEYDTPQPGQTCLTQPDGQTKVYTHQGLRLGTEIQDQSNLNASLEFESHERVTSLEDRAGGVTSVSYHDRSGKIASLTDALGQTTSFYYEPQSQTFKEAGEEEGVNFIFYDLVTIQYPDGSEQAFTYDTRG